MSATEQQSITRVPRMAVFVSGSGRTLENFFQRIDAGTLRAEIPLVVASRECRGAELARARAVVPHASPTRTEVIPWRAHTRESLDALLRSANVQWCVLAGYLHLLPIPEAFKGRVVNIHPALLPDFGGPGMYGHKVHQAVIAAGAKHTGCTVHLCDDEYDRGPIIAQASCEVRPDDTPETLARRVFELELDLYPRALTKLFGG
ncbi:MAG: phosphoribosylglycinamide formyltransferase [Phycisphaerales bacterium]